LERKGRKRLLEKQELLIKRGYNLPSMQRAPVPSYKVYPPAADKLMVRFQARLDPDAFEQIVSCYMSPALAVARQILLDNALAEDAVQESFIRVIRKRNQYIAGSPFSCWFYAIVRNVCLDMLRQQNREKKAVEEIATRAEPSILRTDLSEIPKLLDVLDRGERHVLELRIVHGLRFRDVAAALGISEETAKKRSQRALKRLRAQMCDSESYPGKLSVAL
jgi:RNA polymerase sigma-70 factor (ECF subfamily)